MCEINVYDHADVLNQTVVSRQLKVCQMTKNSFHTFSCNTYLYNVLSSLKNPDKEINFWGLASLQLGQVESTEMNRDKVHKMWWKTQHAKELVDASM